MLANSIELFARGCKVIPGGVNSPVRAFSAVGGQPIFFKSGSGAYLSDVDNNKYVDYVGSWGPLILGHCNPQVQSAVAEAIKHGLSFGAPCAAEVELAELITQLMPSIESIRMVNSGTEATLSALRVARGFTRRDKILKFSGCYHGHSDSLLVKAGSGPLTLGLPDSVGVPPSMTANTLVAPFNNISVTNDIFKEYGDEIAAVIVEPIAGNMNMVLPNPEFLPGLRHLCDHYGSLLIFDEVMTGFRVALGGAQELYQVTPDLTCLGKVIGGGMPVGAFGGRKEIMNMLAPIGPVYQAGTLSGNPIAMTAGISTIKQLMQADFYSNLNKISAKLTNSIAEASSNNNIPVTTVYKGGMFGFSFVDDPNQEIFQKFHQIMLKQGIYFAPSAFEAGFVSSAHDDNVLLKTDIALNQGFAAL